MIINIYEIGGIYNLNHVCEPYEKFDNSHVGTFLKKNINKKMQ